MFHKATNLQFLDGTMLEITFQDGKIKRYDMAALFEKYPQLRALQNRTLFLSGKLTGPYGIIWNDDLDIETETIYEDGITVGTSKKANHTESARAVLAARAKAGLSQKELARLSGIDQSDLSKIERGIGNPTVAMLERIARAAGGQLHISIVKALQNE